MADPVAAARELGALFARDAVARDAERRFPHAELDALRASGLLAFRVGGGADVRVLCDVIAALAEGDASIAQMYVLHETGVQLINEGGLVDGPRRELQRRLREERILITNAFSERTTPTAMEHSLRLTRQPSGDFLLNGRKFYSTGSLGGQVAFVGGWTDDPEPEHRVAFVDTDAAGVTIHDDWSGMGQRTTASGTTEFHDTPVRADYTFPTSPDPLSLAGSLGQLMFAALFVGIARAALRDTIEYVRTHARAWGTSGVQRAADDPYKLLRIGESALEVSAAESLLERAVAIRLEGQAGELSARTIEDRARVVVACVEANVGCGRAALHVSERLFEECGASSVLAEYGFDRHWRNVRTLTLHDPTDYKLRIVGDYVVNGAQPPVALYY
jgi:alkylation response protein AidB-like acyl-CoA dehydrogenase